MHKATMNNEDAMQTKETFGVFAEVSSALSDEGYPSITLYTSRGDSTYGQSLSGFWSLTLEEAVALGASLIEQAGRAKCLSEQAD